MFMYTIPEVNPSQEATSICKFRHESVASTTDKRSTLLQNGWPHKTGSTVYQTDVYQGFT